MAKGYVGTNRTSNLKGNSYVKDTKFQDESGGLESVSF